MQRDPSQLERWPLDDFSFTLRCFCFSKVLLERRLCPRVQLGAINILCVDALNGLLREESAVETQHEITVLDRIYQQI